MRGACRWTVANCVLGGVRYRAPARGAARTLSCQCSCVHPTVVGFWGGGGGAAKRAGTLRRASYLIWIFAAALERNGAAAGREQGANLVQGGGRQGGWAHMRQAFSLVRVSFACSTSVLRCLVCLRDLTMQAHASLHRTARPQRHGMQPSRATGSPAWRPARCPGAPPPPLPTAPCCRRLRHAAAAPAAVPASSQSKASSAKPTPAVSGSMVPALCAFSGSLLPPAASGSSARLPRPDRRRCRPRLLQPRCCL